MIIVFQYSWDHWYKTLICQKYAQLRRLLWNLEYFSGLLKRMVIFYEQKLLAEVGKALFQTIQTQISQFKLQYQSMTKLQTIFLVLAILGLASSQKVVSFVCEQVSSSVCPSQYRYSSSGSFQGKMLNTTYCLPSGQTCTPKTTKFNMQTCKVDYKNTACSTGVCFMYPAYQVCTKDLTCGTVAAPKAYYDNYKCDACTDAAACAKCFFRTTNESSSEVITSTCLGANCTEGLSTATANVKQCQGGFDQLGQKCECCVLTQEVSRFCTTNSEALSQADITNWVKFESKLQMLLGFIAIALMGIFY